MRESKIERESREWATSAGWLTMKYTGERGYPDRIFIKDGVTLWIEFKKPGEKPTNMQLYRLRKLGEAGALAYCADSVERVRYIIEMYDPTI